MSLTGLTWSFPWYRAAFYKVFGVEVQQRAAYGQERKGGSQKGDTELALRDGRKEGNKEHSETVTIIYTLSLHLSSIGKKFTIS